MNQMTDELAVRKSVFVRCTPEHAFHGLHRAHGDWWPIEGHSIFDDRPRHVVWEGHVGGRVYERSSKGEEGVWGTIVVWDPPSELDDDLAPRPRRGDGAGARASASRPRATGRGSTSCTPGWERVGDRTCRERMAATTRAGAWCSAPFAEAAGDEELRCTRTSPGSSRRNGTPTCAREARPDGRATAAASAVEAPAWRARSATPARRPARAPARSPRARGRPSARRRPGAGRS